uniref:Uncharacterized protein n=1 Tax=Lepeophtheirus salmonis TaxID=72036 RepID=A0A0K2UDH1_LEPSM
MNIQKLIPYFLFPETMLATPFYSLKIIILWNIIGFNSMFKSSSSSLFP